MAEELVISCDPCRKGKNQRVEAIDTLRLMINDEPLRIDVCQQHQAELTRMLDMMVDVGWQDEDQKRVARLAQRGKGGRKPAPELAQSPDARGCPMCFSLLSTPGNAGHHVRRMHPGKKIEEWSLEEREAATREARKRLMQGTPPGLEGSA